MAIIGFGATLEVNDGASNADQAFVEVKSITVPKADQEYVDASYLNMPDRYRRYVAGLIAPGDMSFELNYNKTDFARCVALRGVSKSYTITFADDSTVEFDGILQNAEVDVQADQIMTIKASVRVTGAITFTPGA